MAEVEPVQVPAGGQGGGTPAPEATPADAATLEAQKVTLAAEVKGLEGTRASILTDIERIRAERKAVTDGQDPSSEENKQKLVKLETDLTNLQSQLTENAQSKSELESKVKENVERVQQLETENKELKEAIVAGVSRRQASVGGAPSAAAPAPAGGDSVELSKEEKEIADIVGLKNPQRMKDVEVL